MHISRFSTYLIILFLFSVPAAGDVTVEKTSVFDTGDTRTWSPAWSPDGNSIAYITYDDSRYQQVFTIRIDGTGKKQVTSDMIKKWGVTWLNGGIAFLSYDTDGLEKIFIVQPDGTGRKKLMDDSFRQGRSPEDRPPLLGSISLNPENGKILFTSFDNMSNEKIYEVASDGTGKKQVRYDEFRQWAPDWSPDGTQLVYVSYDDRYIEQLFIMNADGSDRRQVTFDDIKKSDPHWGPEGILFVSYVTMFSSGEKIFIINPDGTGRRLLLEDGYKQRNPRWSPDYLRIIFEEIDAQGQIIFKVVDLQRPVLPPTPIPTVTPMETISPTVTEITPPPTVEETPQVEEPPGEGLKEVLLTMFLVLVIIVIVMLGILIISDMRSKK